GVHAHDERTNEVARVRIEVIYASVGQMQRRGTGAGNGCVSVITTAVYAAVRSDAQAPWLIESQNRAVADLAELPNVCTARAVVLQDLVRAVAANEQCSAARHPQDAVRVCQAAVVG